MLNHNVIFPLPMTLHIIFVALCVLFFMIMYFRKKYVYYMLLTITALSTFLIYLCPNGLPRRLLGLEELVLLVLSIIFMVKAHKQEEKEAEKSSKGGTEDKSDENSNS